MLPSMMVLVMVAHVSLFDHGLAIVLGGLSRLWCSRYGLADGRHIALATCDCESCTAMHCYLQI